MRVAAQLALADTPLTTFLRETVVPYEDDEVTRLIVDTHDREAFAPIAHLTLGGWRDWLLSDAADTATLRRLAPGVTPEMAAAVSKVMRNQDLIAVARKCEVVTRFRNTIGLKGRLAVRLQPNHGTDDPRGIAASIIDGLCYGSGDAVIGINPATDSPASTIVAAPDARRAAHAVRDPDAILRPLPCDDDDADRRAGAGGPGVPVDWRDGGDESELRREPVAAGGGARRGAVAASRDGRPARDVLRDRPGQRAVGGGARRRRSADLRGAGVRGGAPVCAAAGEHGGRVHRPGVSVRRQADHPRRARGSFLRQADGPADGRRHLSHQSCGGRSGRPRHAC